MRTLLPLFLIAACGSSAMEPPPGTTPDGPAQPPIDGGGDMQPGFTIHLGSDYQSSGTVTLAAARTNGVYAGYFTASSDFATVPNVSVSIHAPDAKLATQAYPCERSASTDPANETAVLIQWLDGDTYYTNLFPSPACTVTITAASQTQVSATISGTTFDEMDPDHPPTSFTASFVASVAGS